MGTDFDNLIDNQLEQLAKSSSLEQGLESPRYTKEELLAFLADVESEDEELANVEIKTALKIEDDNDESEEHDIGFGLQDVSEESSISSEITGEEETEQERKMAWSERLAIANRRWKHKREIESIDIRRFAFEQKALPLGSTIPIEHKRLLIKLLTKPIRDLIIKYDKYIKKRVTNLLSPAIPVAIKLANKKWPWCFVQNPGFFYTTSRHNGEVKTFWVTPDVPYFFKQGTEMTILEERDAELTPFFLDKIDRAVINYYKAKERLANREVIYAMKLRKLGGGYHGPISNHNTYYDLLKLNPHWFKTLYDGILKINSDLL